VRGLRRAKKRIKPFGNSFGNLRLKTTGLGKVSLTPMAASAMAFSNMGDQVAAMAKRTVLNVETLSELRFVAFQTGTQFESLAMAFRRMQARIPGASLEGKATTASSRIPVLSRSWLQLLHVPVQPYEFTSRKWPGDVLAPHGPSCLIHARR